MDHLSVFWWSTNTRVFQRGFLLSKSHLHLWWLLQGLQYLPLNFLLSEQTAPRLSSLLYNPEAKICSVCRANVLNWWLYLALYSAVEYYGWLHGPNKIPPLLGLVVFLGKQSSSGCVCIFLPPHLPPTLVSLVLLYTNCGTLQGAVVSLLCFRLESSAPKQTCFTDWRFCYN